MNNLIILNGAMGAGKTAVSLELKKLLPACVRLEGDWCWDMSPFVVNERTKAMALDNMTFLLNRFIDSGEFENIVFCWVMPKQEIIEEILGRLKLGGFAPRVYSLVCRREVLRARLGADVAHGIREAGVIARSERICDAYEKMNTVSVDVSDISARDAALYIFHDVCGNEAKPAAKTDVYA